MVELEDFKYGGTNISALRLVDPAEEKVGLKTVGYYIQILFESSLHNSCSFKCQPKSLVFYYYGKTHVQCATNQM